MRWGAAPLLLAAACALFASAAKSSEVGDAFARERRSLAAANLWAKAERAQREQDIARMQQEAAKWDEASHGDTFDEEDPVSDMMGEPPTAMSPESIGVVGYQGTPTEDSASFSPLSWFYGHMANAVGAGAAPGPRIAPLPARATSWKVSAVPEEEDDFARSQVDAARNSAYESGFLQGVVATGKKAVTQERYMAIQLQRQAALVGELEEIVHSLQAERRAKNFEKTREAAEIAHERAAEQEDKRAEAAEKQADRVTAAASEAEADATAAKKAEEAAEAEYEAARKRIEQKARDAWSAAREHMDDDSAGDDVAEDEDEDEGANANVTHGRMHRVHVAVYTESECPGCRAFIRTDLADLVDGLGKFVTVHEVPYGNAWFNTTSRQIDCQHGPAECEGNRIMLCGMKAAKSWRKWFPVSVCMSAHDGTPREAFADCLNGTSIDADAVLACADGIEGEILHTKAGNRTLALQPPHEFTPWVTVNGEHTQGADVMAAVCKQLPATVKEAAPACNAKFSADSSTSVLARAAGRCYPKQAAAAAAVAE